MLDPSFQEKCRRLNNSRIVERRKQVEAEFRSINAKAASRGMYNSGVTYGQKFQLLCHELEIRSTVAWQDIVRVHKILGSPNSATLRDDLKREHNIYVQEAYEELSAMLSNILKDAKINAQLSLDSTRDEVINKHDIEIDLYGDSLALLQQENGGKDAMSSQYNFYGNVGAVQTGANASANIVQNLGSDDKAAIIEALNSLKEQLKSSQEANTSQMQELVEIVDECVELSGSSTPNNTKLLTLLNVVGLTVQSYASAQPAYNTLKSVLIPLGIVLP